MFSHLWQMCAAAPELSVSPGTFDRGSKHHAPRPQGCPRPLLIPSAVPAEPLLLQFRGCVSLHKRNVEIQLLVRVCVCVGRCLIAHDVPLKRLHLRLNLAGCIFQLSSLQCCTNLLQRRGHGTPPGGETNTLTKLSRVRYNGGLLTSTFTQVGL